MRTAAPPSEPAAQRTPRWAGAAADYDVWFDKPWGRYAFAVECGAVIRAAGALDAIGVLDAGCGPGRFGAALADRHAAVIGIDATRDMLTLADGRLAGGCAQAVVERLPFPDNTFDLTLAVTLLEYVADPVAALAEIARVTRHGGRILVGAVNPHSPWGLANRGRLRSGEWCDARFLSRRELRALAAPYGRAELHAVLYAPGVLPSLVVMGGVLETIGRLFPRYGAFQLLSITKDTTQ